MPSGLVDVSDAITASPPPFINGNGALEASVKRLMACTEDTFLWNPINITEDAKLNLVRVFSQNSQQDNRLAQQGRPLPVPSRTTRGRQTPDFCKNHFSREL